MNAETSLVDRNEEGKAIESCIRDYRNCFIFGNEGVGKSFLVRKIAERDYPHTIFYSADSRSIKVLLINWIISGLAFFSVKDLYRKNQRELKSIFYRMIDKKRCYMIADHILPIGPKYCAFLKYLMEQKGFSLMVIARSYFRKDIGSLETIIYDFEKIEIDNLSRKHSDLLIFQLMQEEFTRWDIKALKQAVWRLSRGNPGMIKKLCSLAREKNYVNQKGFNTKLLNLDYQIMTLSEKGG